MAPTRSTSIGHKAAQTLYYARQQAERLGLGLNVLVTINFAATTIAQEDATKAFGRLRLNHFNKWATRPRKGGGPACEPTYRYYFENARDRVAYEAIGEGEPHNVHVHWEVYVHPKRIHDFGNRLVEWLDQIAGELSAANAVKVKPVSNGKGLRAYSLKGANKRSADHFGAGYCQTPQGLILGRRTGTSVNLGPSARIAMDRVLGIRRQRAA